MERIVASVPDSVEELCVVRLGLMVRKIRALPYALQFGRAIGRSAKEAIEAKAGLLSSEVFFFGWNHFGVFQYWSSFEALEAWSHRPPHSDWWRGALDRMRTKADFGIYHETYLIPKAGVESIYLNCPRVGLSSFGVTGEAVGNATASRDRLRRRDGKG